MDYNYNLFKPVSEVKQFCTDIIAIIRKTYCIIVRVAGQEYYTTDTDGISHNAINQIYSS